MQLILPERSLFYTVQRNTLGVIIVMESLFGILVDNAIGNFPALFLLLC